METFSDSSLVLVPSMETLVPLSWPFFSIYNSNDKLEQRHLVFVFNKNHNAPTQEPEKSFFQNWGTVPQFWEKAPPLKNGQFWGQKRPENTPYFFHGFLTYTKFTFCKKKWSKSTNPVLSSDPNNLLPLIGGCHHQLDDQYKEPMVNTKIIELGD